MPVCAICRLSKPGVKLCADDLLCPDCFHDNECKLAELKKQHTLTLSSVPEALPTGAESTNNMNQKPKTAAPTKLANSAANVAITASVTVSDDPHGQKSSKTKRKTTKQGATTTSAVQPTATYKNNDFLFDADVGLESNQEPSTVSNIQMVHEGGTLSSAAGVGATELSDEMLTLRLVVQQQQLAIDSLQQQLKLVLGFLGLPDSEHLSNSDQTKIGANPSLVDCSTPAATSTVYSNPSYASVVNSGKPPTFNTFQHAILTTVEAENRRKLERQKNVVISGLRTSNSQTDSQLVQTLISNELKIQPNIVTCQRLGKPSPDRVQLVKVCLSSTQEATNVLSAARGLRQSTDDYIRKSVYINRDLTKAETLSAYQERCRRREKQTNAQQQPQQQQPPTTQSDISGGLSLLNVACNPHMLIPPPTTNQLQQLASTTLTNTTNRKSSDSSQGGQQSGRQAQATKQ
jgi:hypothetical protein